MKQLKLAALAILGSFALSSCGGDSPEDVAQDILDKQGEIAAIVEGVAGGGDISEATEKITKVGAEMSALMKKAQEEAKAMSEDDAKALMEKNKDLTQKGVEIGTKIAASLQKLAASGKATPEFQMAVTKALSGQ